MGEPRDPSSRPAAATATCHRPPHRQHHQHRQPAPTPPHHHSTKHSQFQAEVYSIARRGLGEEVKTTGGLFGVGGKAEPAPTPAEAKTELLAAYEKAKVAYNDYCVINNEGRPFEIDELSEL